MKPLRVAWRLLGTIWRVLAGYFTVLVVFPRLTPAQQQDRVQAWARRMLDGLGITLERRGAPAAGPVLQVANHISWLDILVLHAGGHCRFVSKADVRHWPLIGRMATGAGTLYIERESRRDAVRVVHHMVESLRAGDVLAVFPEGTTSDGESLLPFHANLIQAAISAGVPVQPVALGFLDARTREFTRRPCYIGDETLVGSVWRILTGAPVVAVVSYGAPEQALGRDRRAWAGDLRRAVAELRA